MRVEGVVVVGGGGRGVYRGYTNSFIECYLEEWLTWFCLGWSWFRFMVVYTPYEA